MAYSIETKQRAINLRTDGHSINEIHASLGVSKGTLSEWLRDIKISKPGQRRLLLKIHRGRHKSAEAKKKKIDDLIKDYSEKAVKDFGNIKLNLAMSKLICALIYYCEGNKSPRSGLRFTNSDPALIKNFLILLRRSFDLDERKFRVCLHLHNYHNAQKQMDFWSKITDIPKSQFIQPYLKKHTGVRIREGYQGCASLRYHDTNLARQLLAIAKAFIHKGV